MFLTCSDALDGYGLKAEQKNVHAKTRRCLDGKVILILTDSVAIKPPRVIVACINKLNDQ